MKKIILFIIISLFSDQIFSQSIDEKIIAETVEMIRKGMIDGDRIALEANTHANLSYGHSNMKLENKSQYVDAIASGYNNFETIELSNQTIQITGKTAVVRHNFKAIYTNDSKPGTANISVLQVYQKSGKKWLLLARQAVKI